MASVDELRQMYLMAASQLESRTGHVQHVSQGVGEDKALCAQVFQGTGKEDILHVLGRLDELEIQLTDVAMELNSLAVRIRDQAATL